MRVVCKLADRLFELVPLARSGLNSRIFEQFFVTDTRQQVDCRITMLGARPALESLRVAGAWHFFMVQGEATIMGGNQSGEVLWRLRGRPPYRELTFEWHPRAFEEMYAQAPAGQYNIALILAVMLHLVPEGGLLLHGSAQVFEGRGIICTGPSGRGKSTISRLFNASGIEVLTDERPIITPSVELGVAYQVHGSPWPSSAGFISNRQAPLARIYFLEHGSEQEILPLTAREALLRLMDVALIPWLSSEFFDEMIPIIERILAVVPYALLRFRPDETVVAAIRRDLKRISGVDAEK